MEKGAVIAELGSKANKEEREMLKKVGNHLGDFAIPKGLVGLL